MSWLMHVVDWAIVGLPAYFIFRSNVASDVDTRTLVIVILTAVMLSEILFENLRLYRPRRGESIKGELREITFAWSAAAALVTLFYFLVIGSEWPLRSFLTWFFVTLFFLFLSRLTIRSTLNRLRTHGLNIRHIALIGNRDAVAAALEKLQHNPQAGFVVHCWVDFESPNKTHDEQKSLAGITFPRRCNKHQLRKAVKQQMIDQAWIVTPGCNRGYLTEILQELEKTTIDIRLIPELPGYNTQRLTLTTVADLPVIDLSVSPLKHQAVYLVKEIEDRVLAALGLVFLMPFLLAIAAAIGLTSRGPILFKQKRLGWDERIIRVYKFRTMVLHQEEPGQITQAKNDDPRVTRVGRFLRKYSLDELPQLYNVLQGRMSLVGPRPFAIEHDSAFRERVAGYMRRYMVKPGMTGWAQIHGLRGEIRHQEDLEKRIEYDRYYIENWSLWLDIRILFMTAIRIFRDPKAY